MQSFLSPDPSPPPPPLPPSLHLDSYCLSLGLWSRLIWTISIALTDVATTTLPFPLQLEWSFSSENQIMVSLFQVLPWLYKLNPLFLPPELLASSCGSFKPLHLLSCYPCPHSLFLCLPGGLLFMLQDPSRVIPSLWRQHLPQPTHFSTGQTVPLSCLQRLLAFGRVAGRRWLGLQPSEDSLACLTPGLRRP